MGFICTALIAPFDMAFTSGSDSARITHLIKVVISSLLIYRWCQADSLERKENMPSGLFWVFLLLGFISLYYSLLGIRGFIIFTGLYYYFFKTRGLKQGTIGIGKSFILWLSMGLIYALSGATVFTILGLEVK